jgi:hypothetical protein
MHRILYVVVAALLVLGVQAAAGSSRTATALDVGSPTQVLGRPTGTTIALSVLAPTALQAYAEFGLPGKLTSRTAAAQAAAGVPLTLTLTGLKPSTRYAYRLRSRAPGEAGFRSGPVHTFQTARAPGSAFTFALQGDSHPERAGKMFGAALYAQTMRNVVAQAPDFYITLGDDFSIDPLISRGTLSREAVDQVYVDQRRYLGIVGASSPLFLANGNHEQAALTNLDGTATSPAVLAGTARTRFYPLPAPNGFYSGDTERVEHIGLLRDYYAWTWGDALFVVIDPYWHSPVQVDAAPGGGGGGKDPGAKNRDWWGITIGDAQYRWLERTLTQSKAKFKFVFAHHVLGTGRGGVEEAGLYEWGGSDPSGAATFAAKRPGWALPIHQLMAKTGVTIFFQGHDHLFARQELAGVVYQETPNPADTTYTAFNRDAYRSGTVLPNSGDLKVTVSPAGVRVDYVLSVLPKDETATRKNGKVAFSYTVKP